MLSLAPNPFRSGWRALAALVALLACAGVRADPTETAGTLPEDFLPALKSILEAAMKQSPQVILKEIEIAQNDARVFIADAQRLPSVNGHLDYAENQTAISSNSSTRSRDSGLFYNFGLAQPMFHWGALKYQSEIARISVAVAEKNYTEARRSLAVTLRHQYLMLIAKKTFVRHGRFALKLQEAELAVLQDKYAHGTTSEALVGGKKLMVEDTSLNVARGEAEFASMRRAFARLAGLADFAEDALPLEIPKPVYLAERTNLLLAGFLRDGAKSTFAAAVAELRIREAELSLGIAKVRLLPKFNLQAGYSVQNSTTASPNAVSQTGIAQENISLAADWRIFDGFATKGEKLVALANKRQHERELQIATETALDDAQQLGRDLALDARAMDMADVRRSLALGLVDRMKEEVGLGHAKPAAVDDATANLYIADFNNANARAAFLWHWSEFVSLAATDPMVNTPSPHNARENRKE